MRANNTLIVVVALLFAAPAFAQESPEAKPLLGQDEQARGEIVYRASLGRADDVKLLIDQGASPNQTSGEGVPILALAAARRDPEGLNVVKLLLKSGADVNGRDHKGKTALFYAALEGNVDIANVLLAAKIDPYALDSDGNPARTVAFTSGHNEVIKAIDDFVTRQAAQPAPPATTPAPISSAPLPDIAPPKEDLDKIADLKKNAPTREDMKRIQEELAAANKNSLDDNAMEKPQPKSRAEIAVKDTATGGKKEEVIQKELEHLSYEMAFNTCGFQYWSYCSDAKQSTELESEELSVAILSYKNKANEIKSKILKDYHVKVDDFNTLVDSAQQRIYNQLNTMHSNRERHEKGVGRMDDMISRCEEIGRQWAVPPPGIKKIDTDNSGGKNSGSSQGSGAKITTAPKASNSGGGASQPSARISVTSSSGQSVPTQQNVVNAQGNSNNKQSGPVQPPLQELPSDSLFK